MPRHNYGIVIAGGGVPLAGTSVSPRYISAVSLLAIFVDEWNYFSVPMLSAFIERGGFHLGSLAMGLVTSAVIGGALPSDRLRAVT